MVRLARVVRLGHDRAARPQARVRQRDVDRPHGEHGGDRRSIGSGVGVAHHQDRLSVGGGGHRLGAEPSERGAQTGGAASGTPCGVQPPAGGSLPPEEALELLQRRGRGVVDQERRPRAEEHGERHHRPFAEMVHRGVRHLREPLAQVVEDRAAVAAERRDRRVVAHRERGLLPVRGRRPDHHAQVLARVAVQDLLRHELVRSQGLDARHLGEPRDPMLLRPGGPRLFVRHGADRVVVQPAVPRIDHDHLTRPELAATNASLRQVDDPGLGRADDEAVVGRPVAQGPEPVAVERRTDGDAIGEDQRRRTVPRLHQGRVPPVEPAPFMVHVGRVLPRGRDDHGDRAADVTSGAARAAFLREDLDGLIEDGRVGPGIVDRGAEERLLRERRESQPALARVHPVRVAGDRVDLAVVTQHPERLRALPRRRGVRGVPLVEHDERRLDVGIEEVGIERGQPVRGGERLVRDGREAAGRDVDIAIRCARERVDAAPCPVRALLRTRGVVR